MSGFLDSIALFGPTYAVGLLSAATLAAVGVWVVARDQIFLGAAVSQASALGVAVALVAAESVHTAAWLTSDAAAMGLAVLAAVITAWFATRPRGDAGASPEAVTGWIFLLASALPVLMLAHSPHGLEEIQRLLFSTLLAVSDRDVALFGGLALLTGVLIARLHDSLLLFAVEPETAEAHGLRRIRWRLATAVWLGLCVGLSMRAAGMLFTFGSLVLPALIARNLVTEVRTLAWAAPAIATCTTAASFVLSHTFDLPPAHTAVGLLAALLPVAWLGRRR